MYSLAGRMSEPASARILVNDPIAVRSDESKELEHFLESLKVLEVSVRLAGEYVIAESGVHSREIIRRISASGHLVRVPVYRRNSLLEIPTGEIVVSFQASVSHNGAIKTLEAGGFEISRLGRFNEFYIHLFPRSEAGAVTAAARLAGLSGIRSAGPVFIVVM
jgi:hypothetical protein